MRKEIEKHANGYRLAKLRTFPGREGNGWVGSLIKDGKLLGDVGDWADGGPIFAKLVEGRAELVEYAESLYGKHKFVSAVDFFLGDLVNYELVSKKIKTASKTKLVLSLPDAEKDRNGVDAKFAYFSMPDSPEARKAAEKQIQGVRFLNDEFADWTPAQMPKSSKKNSFSV